MAISVRLIEEEDFVEVSAWFADSHWKTPPMGNNLPESGYIAEEGGRKLAVAWLYVTNSGVALVDWVKTNPEVGGRGVFAVKKLMGHIEAIAENQINSIIYVTPNDRLAGFLKSRCGFKTRKENVCVRSLS